MASILIYVDNLERARFFSRMAHGLSGLGHNVIYLASGLSVRTLLRSRGVAAWPLLRRHRCCVPVDGVAQSVDVLQGTQSVGHATDIAQVVIGNMYFLSERIGFDSVWLWNGARTDGIAVRHAATALGSRTCFFEVGNLPGKVFVDPWGVNAQSRVYAHPEILRHFAVGSNTYDEWCEKYRKMQNVQIPQVRNTRRLNMLALLDVAGSNILGWQRVDYVSVGQRAWKKLRLRYGRLNLTRVDLSHEYIFFPLQVTADSQLLINSSYDNWSALDYALAEANKQRVSLLVKPHPAETDVDFLSELGRRARRAQFTLAGNSTLELIRCAQQVITINSTVGLQARLEGKPVVFLGKSLFDRLSDEDIKRYICGYLLDIDYAAEGAIPTAVLEQIMARESMTFF